MILHRLILIGTTLLIANSALASSEGLTKIERMRCHQTQVPLPVKSFEEMEEGIDYKYEISFEEYDCNTPDRQGRLCYWNSAWFEFELTHRYPFLTIYDYFTATGQLVTSRTERSVTTLQEKVFGFAPAGKWSHVGYKKFVPEDQAAIAYLKAAYEKSKEQMQKAFRRTLVDCPTGLCP